MIRTPVVECSSVRKSFGHRTALDTTSFAGYSGEIIGLVGPNGAGKTTLLRVIAGVVSPDGGAVTVAGREPGSVRGRSLIGFAADPPSIPPEITGHEWLKYLAGSRSRGPRGKAELLGRSLELADVSEFAGRRVAHLSRGMLQQLALAGSLLCGKKLVLLDETLGNIDPLVVRSVEGPLARVAEAGRAVIISSHDLRVVEKVATRVLVMVGGRIVSDSNMASLLDGKLAEVWVDGTSLNSIRFVESRFPKARRTGAGFVIPLDGGMTLEEVLSVCRDLKIVVRGSKLRYRGLEDLLVSAVEEQADVRSA